AHHHRQSIPSTINPSPVLESRFYRSAGVQFGPKRPQLWISNRCTTHLGGLHHAARIVSFKRVIVRPNFCGPLEMGQGVMGVRSVPRNHITKSLASIMTNALNSVLLLAFPVMSGSGNLRPMRATPSGPLSRCGAS